MTGDGAPVTAESIVYAALNMGLTVADLDCMTVGMMNDLAIEISSEGEREATQADYDSF